MICVFDELLQSMTSKKASYINQLVLPCFISSLVPAASSPPAIYTTRHADVSWPQDTDGDADCTAQYITNTAPLLQQFLFTFHRLACNVIPTSFIDSPRDLHLIVAQFGPVSNHV